MPRSSKYRGVSFYKAYGKWEAYIKNSEGKNLKLGYFEEEAHAALAYNAKALELYGNKAKLNLITGWKRGETSKFDTAALFRKTI